MIKTLSFIRRNFYVCAINGKLSTISTHEMRRVRSISRDWCKKKTSDRIAGAFGYRMRRLQSVVVLSRLRITIVAPSSGQAKICALVDCVQNSRKHAAEHRPE